MQEEDEEEEEDDKVQLETPKKREKKMGSLCSNTRKSSCWRIGAQITIQINEAKWWCFLIEGKSFSRKYIIQLDEIRIHTYTYIHSIHTRQWKESCGIVVKFECNVETTYYNYKCEMLFSFFLFFSLFVYIN